MGRWRALVAVGCAVGCAAACACGGGKRRQTRSHDAAPVVPIALPTDAGATAADEVEPDDSLDAAMPLALGVTLHGRVDPPFTDADFYRIDVPRAGALALELSAVDKNDLTLELLDGSGEVVARSDRGGARGREGIPNVGVEPGRYTAVIRGKKPNVRRGRRPPPAPPVAPYELTARVVTPAANAEREPDGDRGTANDLIIGDPVTGFVGWGDDTDVWKLSLEALAASNTIDLELSGVDQVTFTLEVADAIGRPLLTRRAARGKGVVIRGLVPNVRPGAPPFQYVTIRGTPSNPEVPYTLKVTAYTPEPDAEIEPDDTPEQAMSFPHDRTVIDGHWSPGDVDCYAFAADAVERTLELAIEVPPEADLSAELVVGGKAIARSDAKGKGAAEKLSGVVPSGARAVLRVRGADGGREARYRVKLTEAAVPPVPPP